MPSRCPLFGTTYHGCGENPNYSPHFCGDYGLYLPQSFVAMPKYIYEYKNWTDFTWQDSVINSIFGEVRLMQGKIIGQMNALGFSAKEEATLTALTMDVVKSSEIEGELLNYAQVRSSIARRLGINTAGLVKSNRNIEGVVEMMLDATQRYNLPLTEKRLFGWHAALFPTGYSGPYKIEVGCYRTGEMQVVSGAMGKEKIHYEAVKPEFVKAEMKKFIAWFNNDNTLDPVIKAAIAHFWFIIIHPFDDGNGRIARALTDMLLARAEGSGDRFYSMSGRILEERKMYYAVLQKVQHSANDITEWLNWFLHCLKNAMLATESTTKQIFRKAEFWRRHENTSINERQKKVLNMLFENFTGKLQSSKWAKINKTSTDTALRDIKDLIEKGILRQNQEGGRSVNYELVDF
jgi:Fic family protein